MEPFWPLAAGRGSERYLAMQDLFPEELEKPAGPDAPLATRMRPRTLDEVVGQRHILGPGKLLRRAIEADRISSIILYVTGSGPIKGFAVTLILGLLINLFTAVFVSRTIFIWILSRNPKMEKLSI